MHILKTGCKGTKWVWFCLSSDLPSCLFEIFTLASWSFEFKFFENMAILDKPGVSTIASAHCVVCTSICMYKSHTYFWEKKQSPYIRKDSAWYIYMYILLCVKILYINTHICDGASASYRELAKQNNDHIFVNHIILIQTERCLQKLTNCKTLPYKLPDIIKVSILMNRIDFIITSFKCIGKSSAHRFLAAWDACDFSLKNKIKKNKIIMVNFGLTMLWECVMQTTKWRVLMHTCAQVYVYRHTSDSAAAVFDFEECSYKQFGTLLSKISLNMLMMCMHLQDKGIKRWFRSVHMCVCVCVVVEWVRATNR